MTLRSRPVGPSDRARQVAARLNELQGVSEELDRAEALLRDLRADLAESEGDLEEQRMDWLRQRQDAETTLQAYRKRARELKARLSALESTGEEAPCPTCGRILEDHLERVQGVLKEEWDTVVLDGRWWRRRREQLDTKPESVLTLESRTLKLHAQIERNMEKAERTRWAVQELAELKEEAAELELGTPLV